MRSWRKGEDLVSLYADIPFLRERHIDCHTFGLHGNHEAQKPIDTNPPLLAVLLLLTMILSNQSFPIILAVGQTVDRMDMTLGRRRVCQKDYGRKA
jgi:hypothetical protein